ncbi:hypothetical protein B7494_g6752 [Chlorociboria aeruginascens]|nr:hypothetical protein B7494_g6752 [Chlorociboria aeruginascens]
MAANAATVIANTDNDANPFQSLEYGPIRKALWGDTTRTATADIVAVYNFIAGGATDVTVLCGEPEGYKSEAETCETAGGDVNMHAYRTFVQPMIATPKGDEDVENNEMLSVGFKPGNNIVICKAFIDGSLTNNNQFVGYQLLSNINPVQGSNIDYWKTNWASLFVHEMSHIPLPGKQYGTFDNAGYGFEVAKSLADPSSSTAPIENADTFGFYALAVSHQSTPNFDTMDWSSGFGVLLTSV